MEKIMLATSIAAVVAFAISALAGPIAIPVLHRLKFGQEIRTVGPSWHKAKSGTPTMGGVIFILAAVAATLIFARDTKGIAMLAVALGFGAIGFVDDFIKVVMKRNLGLTALQKFLAQVFVSVVFVLAGMHFNLLHTSVTVPFLRTPLDLGWLYIPFAVFLLIGVPNAVNLTDGLDGLAASVTVVVSLFFTVAALGMQEESVSVFSGVITGGCLGFLLFNAYPAKVFMGDTGSLFLGGAVVAMALILDLGVVLVIVGGVYVLETVSVIIQVTSFKLTGKRVFKMTPIHHHFEMCGWSERKIVLTAIVASVVLAAVGLISIL